MKFEEGWYREETWRDVPEFREKNNGWGVCNTGSGYKCVCIFGGVGCNVDHKFIFLWNLISQK